jgi:2-polyprenyl-3-methyl-5-hydroxy-6-metoxy-1,4-benzoquinol methylase
MKAKWIVFVFPLMIAAQAGWTVHVQGGATPQAALSQEFSQRPRLDVPFVPTNEEVVEEMIRIAQITKGDIVYDLGCGDGRIVIAAARKSGAACVGVDIDPARIKECRENAAKAGVSERVKFYQKDLFQTDLSGATVVTLYLLPDVNLKLRPKLLKELKPGARIVSHNYHMKQWRPDDFRRIGAHTVYFWVVPANVSGTWKWTVPQGTESASQTLRLEQDFQNAGGYVTSGMTKMPVKNFRLVGDRLSFTIVQKIEGETVPVRFIGQVNGNTISGFSFNGSHKQKWTAKRDASTIIPLDGSRLVKFRVPGFEF